MASFCHDLDVVIVGGGMSGLFMAYRIAMCTQLKVAVLEATSRFGGRYRTCKMPGNFNAELGAMRFFPTKHPLIVQMIEELGLQTEKLFKDGEQRKNAHRDYFMNNHIRDLDHSVEVYSVKERDLRYFTPAGLPLEIKLPPNNDVYEGEVAGTEQLAKDMSMGQHLSLSQHSGVIARGYGYPLSLTVGDTEAFDRNFQTNDGIAAEYYTVSEGMEMVTKKLVKELSRLNVGMYDNCTVNGVTEQEHQFTVSVENIDAKFTARKVVLACNREAVNTIWWNGAKNRLTQLHKLFSKVIPIPGVKVFFTYREPWWEQAGLVCGTLCTDLPITEVTAFGTRGKSSKYATLLAAFTYLGTEIFEGLNLSRYKRFVNSCGDIAPELIPSQLLVNYVQDQLKVVFGLENIPSPVCAVTGMWLGDPIAGNYQSRVGVNSYQLQFEGLKPFADADVYITGDTFTANTKKLGFVGWSEGVLLNSERILTKYFGLQPYVPDVPLHNEYAQMPNAKL